MELEKVPRGREHPRAIDAAPVPEPHGAGHEYTDRADAGQPQAEAEAGAPAGATAPEQQAVGLAETDCTGWKVTDEFGRTVGKVERTVDPEWLVVRDRRGRHLLVPSAGAIAGGESVFVPYEADLVSAAPRLDGDEEPDEATIASARAHYG